MFRKGLAVLFFSTVLAFCAFSAYNGWFTMSLTYGSARECSVHFWSPSTVDEFANKTVDITSRWGEADILFSSLGIEFNGNLSITLDLGYTPFYQKTTTGDTTTLDTSTKCSYALGITEKGDSSLFVHGDAADLGTENGFVIGFQVTYKKMRLVQQKDPSILGVETSDHSKRIVADLSIQNLDTSSASTGEFVSYMICYITIN